MNQTLEPMDIHAITALTIDTRPNEVKAIIKKHGVLLPSNASTKQIETAFASLLTKSEAFRNDFAQLASQVVATDTHVGADGFDPNAIPSKGISTSSTSNVTLSNIPSNITSTSKATTYDAKKPFSQTGLGKFLSSVFTPETVQSGISTGLNIWSIKQTGQPASALSSDLNAGREQLNQGNQPTKGTSTTTLVLIGVGALALIGVAVYFYKKK